MLRLIETRDARVRAHSWAGAMVTDNAAPDDWRRMSRVTLPCSGATTPKVAGARDRARRARAHTLKV